MNLFPGIQHAVRSTKTHRGANTEVGFSPEHTPQADVLSFLSSSSAGRGSLPALLNASLPPSILWQCIYFVHVCVYKSSCVCLHMRESECVSEWMASALLLPPRWVFPSPWLLLSLAFSLLQQIIRSWEFHIKCLLSPFPSFIFSPTLFLPVLLHLYCKIKLLAWSAMHCRPPFLCVRARACPSRSAGSWTAVVSAQLTLIYARYKEGGRGLWLINRLRAGSDKSSSSTARLIVPRLEKGWRERAHKISEEEGCGQWMPC